MRAGRKSSSRILRRSTSNSRKRGSLRSIRTRRPKRRPAMIRVGKILRKSGKPKTKVTMVETWSDYVQWAGNLDVGGSILKEIANFRQHARRAALLIAAGILAAGVTPAQEVSENLYSGMKWRMIGPFRAGKVNAVAGVPGNPAVYYFAADGGGVWKTTDGGTVWKPIFDKEAVASIGAMALAPSNPNIIYVGTGVNTIFADSGYGDGVYKSLDGGENWQHAGLEDTRHIGRILVDPHNPDIVLVAAMGHSSGPNEERGVFRSADGGRTWKKVLYKDNVTAAVDLCFEPGNPRVVYATLWHGIRKPGQEGTSYGPGSGLYKSLDEGITWKQITGHGLPEGDWGRAGVAVAPGNRGQRVYVIVEAKEKKGGLFRSDDAGTTWKRAT